MIWDTPWSPYAGASDNFQTLYEGNQRLGKIHGWSDDGDWGYDAYDVGTYLGTFKTRAEAQKAVEAAIK